MLLRTIPRTQLLLSHQYTNRGERASDPTKKDRIIDRLYLTARNSIRRLTRSSSWLTDEPCIRVPEVLLRPVTSLLGVFLIKKAITSSKSSRKGQKSGPAAIFALSESIESVASVISNPTLGTSSQMQLTSPQRKTAAIRAIEENENLEDEEMIDVVDMIREKTDIADMYLALTKTSTRSAYLRKQIDKHL